MASKSKISGIRELSRDEVEEVNGGFKVSAFGITVEASAEHVGVAVSIEGVGGIAVSHGGVSVKDAKGNVSSVPWGGGK